MYDTQSPAMSNTQPASVEADLYGPLPDRMTPDELDDEALDAVIGAFKMYNPATTLFTPWKRKTEN